MPSIEFWFLLHFIKTTRNFRNAGEVLIDLRNYSPNFSKGKGYLENREWVRDLCQEGKLEAAIKNASDILAEKDDGDENDYFPYSRIGEVIQWLEKNKK